MARSCLSFILLAFLAAAVAAGCAPRAIRSTDPDPDLAQPMPPSEARPSTRPASPMPCWKIVRIDVSKSERILRATCERGATVAMPVSLGAEPLGAKRRSGDQRTPEGGYHVAEPARTDRFHRFIPIDYPSALDAARAMADGRIEAADYDRVVEAHERGVPPPQDTPLGGELGLHGEGDPAKGRAGRVDWTDGSVAVSDADIEFLSERVSPGVPVWIVP